jgi:hypothetical protein
VFSPRCQPDGWHEQVSARHRMRGGKDGGSVAGSSRAAAGSVARVVGSAAESLPRAWRERRRYVLLPLLPTCATIRLL